MKKTLLLLGVSLFSMAIASAQTVGDIFSDGNYAFKVVSTSPLDVTVTGFSAAAGTSITAVEIPATATNAAGPYTVPVTSVGTHNTSTTAGAFYANTLITSVVLPASVKVIGTAAFKSATNLATINMENIEETKSNCFASCTKLESTGTLSSLVTIGNYTFSQCVKLLSIVIPVAKTIGDGGISNANVGTGGISSIEIPGSVTSIGSIFLGRLGSLTTIRVHWPTPASVTVNATNFLRDLDQTTRTLKVPAGTTALYSASTSIWKNFIIVEDSTLGTYNVEKELGASIYPNPTDGKVTLKMDTTSAVDVTVYDLNGRALINQKVSGSDSEINLSNVPSGIYLFKGKTATGEFVKRIVKQ